MALEYAKHAQKEGDLKEVINNLRNATKKAEKIGVNKASLLCEIQRTRAMMAISKGDYSRAYSLWKELWIVWQRLLKKQLSLNA